MIFPPPMIPLLKRHPYLLGFCVLTAAFSAPGQTYFISLYVPSIREELLLSRSETAALYSGATIVASALIPLIGRLLDRFPPVRISSVMGLGVAAGCAVLGFSQGGATVFLAFCLLRLFGQSGMSITAVTTAARPAP